MQKKFSIDARALIHLGRESIKNHTTALIELVKNSYDADANVVEIDINTDPQNSYVRISDDGDGMTEDDIDNKWLRIGFSHKKTEKSSNTKQRRKTGEKGIGRLSADRLGEVLEIKTKTDETEIFGLKINWEMFNQDGLDLTDIPIDVIDEPDLQLPRLARKETGTEMLVYNLRENWTFENIETLYNELSILSSPFADVEDFEIFLTNDVAKEFNGKIKPPQQVRPEIEIELDYDGESFDLAYSIRDRSSEEEFIDVISWQNLMQKVIDPFNYQFTDKLLCGPVKIKLLLYPRTKALAEGTDFTLTELREYVNKNVGVKIYRDQISVKPYGFTNIQHGGDWLGLAERHSRNPAGVDREGYRVLGSQLVGAIFIERDKNPLLTDSASREGLVENDAFYDLRALTLGALALLENRRHKLFKDQKGTQKPKTPSEKSDIFKSKIDNVKKDVDVIKNTANIPDEVKNAVDNIEEFIDLSQETSVALDEVLNHNRVLTGLATLGISSAVFAHETQTAITGFNSAAKVARDWLEYPNQVAKVKKELDKAIDYGDQVSSWGAFALTRVHTEKRKKEPKQIDDIIEKILKDLEKVFLAVNIIVETNISPVKAKVFPMDIESIILNVLTNSYTACLQKPADLRRIVIDLSEAERENIKGFNVTISNSGPFIDESLLEWIWKPLNTLKKDSEGKETGTGLGLFIIKSTIESIKGKYEVLNNTDNEMVDFNFWIPLK
ncbi:ATP-binding protein [Chryseobacterium sp. MEBOG07]|uniref:ATP-binding protein n=1 Tax=Chryseobacterium sp. MEBOG07 TaxID=2879939 RepID=UPI001F1C953A|nr:ATP-binding protein [Chryseobacterium sp. MEBOG07]UKB79558.1 ATP-binding protein [Chryseobacterium sp. MEBOG07]